MEPQTKRLRGWQLEVEKDKGKKNPLRKGTEEPPSALGTLSLTLWSHGQINAKSLQEIAHRAILDGATLIWARWQDPEIGERFLAIATRDVMTNYAHSIQITPPVNVQAPVMDSKTGN